ncbi:ATP-grasp domain-containing protein [Bauldia sp.]|uniref:ATP-grasp domain-containing protein n=1 Tax=Bauldia sp. TaxID=2575872 RepID=UPI003BAB5C5F
MKNLPVTWILQSNAIGQGDYNALTKSIGTLGCRLETLRVIPFDHEPAEPLPDIDGPCIVYGSSGLLRIARENDWIPGGWDGPAFAAGETRDRLGEIALNGDAVTTTWSDAARVARQAGWTKVFIRPDSETKEFPGKVYGLPDLEAWASKLVRVGYFDNNDNAALVGQAWDLGREWRVFVVDGELVSFCQYADGGIPTQSAGAPDHVLEFTNTVVSLYAPAPCFVVDIAEVPGRKGTDLRVVEFNSINSAGFYRCDIPRIVERLSEFAVTCQ